MGQPGSPARVWKEAELSCSQANGLSLLQSNTQFAPATFIQNHRKLQLSILKQPYFPLAALSRLLTRREPQAATPLSVPAARPARLRAAEGSAPIPPCTQRPQAAQRAPGSSSPQRAGRARSCEEPRSPAAGIGLQGGFNYSKKTN